MDGGVTLFVARTNSAHHAKESNLICRGEEGGDPTIHSFRQGTGGLLFDYYRSIIPEPERWFEALADPLPTTCWTNTLKTTPESLQTILNQDAFNTTPLAWSEQAFRVVGAHSLGNHWAYRVGLLHIQEEASMLAGMVLGAAPGERILDLCSAPGNKSAQLSVMMRQSGTLIANDRNYGRMRALGQTLLRLGLLNVSSSIYDGTVFPGEWDAFDRVLVDAPCSCEGTFRKKPRKIVAPNPGYSRRLADTQAALLNRALKLCRVGGRVLYSTCTFSPEENEAVVDYVLKKFKGELVLIPIEVPGFIMTPGLVSWQGCRFDERLVHTRRVWPHLNDTGGFYLALFEKKTPSRLDPLNVRGSEVRSLFRPLVDVAVDCPTHTVSSGFSALEPFGFDAKIFESVSFKPTERGFYAVNKDHALPPDIKVDASGLFFLKTRLRYPKLSSAAGMLWGRFATRRSVLLNASQREAYLRREAVLLHEDQYLVPQKKGYVIVCYGDYGLGLGLYLPASQGQPVTLQSLFPKSLCLP